MSLILYLNHMLNEDKIRLMTQLALYEKKEGKQGEKAEHWFRADYISRQMLGTFLCTTIAFAILFLVYALYHLGDILTRIYTVDIWSVVRSVLAVYLLFLAGMLGITWFVYSYRYRKAQKGLRRYYKILRKLSQEYGEDSENQ